MSKRYEYISEEERTFPTLGISCKKGDVFESEFEINNPHVKEITDNPVDIVPTETETPVEEFKNTDNEGSVQ